MPTLDQHAVVAITQDGKVIAKARSWQVLASGTSNITCAIPDLRYVETVLNVEFYSSPDTNVAGGYMDKKITGNVVGMTIYGLTAGTTLSWEIVAVGPP